MAERKKREPIKTEVMGLDKRLRLRAARRMDKFLAGIVEQLEAAIGRDGGSVECDDLCYVSGTKLTISDLIGSLTYELEPVLLPTFEEKAIAEFMEQAGNLSGQLDTEEAEQDS